ncbi:ABC transporter permease [Asanoa sp. NPDC050611]|uniref:ABC transporter permease n=1 Tax=Asanoa sp. NPDC050611 TaxID=3157098 RepID=UPI003406970F
MTGAITDLPEVAPRPPAARRRWAFLRWVPVSVVGLYILVAIVGPLLVDYDPVATGLTDRLLPPGATTHDGGLALLGTDPLGRDIFAQVVYGARTSVTIGALTVALSALVGVTVGVVAGYFGRAVDAALSRSIDVLLAFPGIVLAIIVAGLFDRSITVVVVALALTGWIPFARMTRAMALTVRNREWVAAARVMGVPRRTIVIRHVLPFVLGPVVALAATDFGLVVLAEAGLSFLGIGLPPTSVSWGQTIATGKEYLSTAWWISAFPGLVLALLVVHVGLLGDQFNSFFHRSGRRGVLPRTPRRAGTGRGVEGSL